MRHVKDGWSWLVAALLCVCHAVTGVAEMEDGERTIRSGSSRVALLELFSSEGCSSCPPAERLLSELGNHPQLWKSFVPLNFHVDYWNYLGWTDRFSSAEYSARQSAYTRSWNGRTNYTPAFVLNGSELRGSFGDLFSTEAKEVGELTLHALENREIRVEFSPLSPPRASSQLRVQVALLGNSLVSNVTSGENSGSTLRFNFVVLKLDERELQFDSKQNAYVARLPWMRSEEAPRGKAALAAWVLNKDSLQPIQVTGGLL